MGQVVTSTLYGTVVDPNGAVIPGATVTLLNVERGSTVARSTGSNGDVIFTALPIGQYEITVEATGFKKLKRSGVNLSAGEEVRLTFAVEIGAVAETVEVKGESVLINTANAEQRSNLELTRVQELPTSRRDWTNLLNLTTGAQVSGGSVRLNGLATDSLRVTVDGTDATQDNELPSFSMSGNFNFIKTVSTEAIAEVNVAKGITSAEIANTMSGNVNIITKSGTNNFHGSLFWLNNVEDLNARNQFLTTKPGLVYNQFGGSFGGPIIRNRIFFFTTYDGYRLRGFTALNGQVPTQEFRDRVHAATSIYDKIFSVYPLPNQRYSPTAITGAWIGAGTEQGNDDHAIVRGDYNITGSTILTTRYTRARPFRLTPRVMQVNSRTYEGMVEQGTANLIHARPTWTFETRFGYNYNHVPRSDNLIGLYTGDPAYGNLTGLGFSSSAELIEREGYTWSLEESVGKQVGRHALKFGGLFLQQHAARVDFQNPDVTYSSEADLINNTPNAVTATIGFAQQADLHTNTLGFFIQDDFKVSPRLMINMGVRYDYYSVPKESHGHLFNRSQPFGTGPYTNPDAIWQPNKLNFSPRAGFAYTLTQDKKTVLRGGAGMFHSPVPLYAGPVDLIRDAIDEPFRVNVARTDVLASGNVFRWPVANDVVRAFIKGKPTLIGDTAVNTYFPQPFSYQWTLGIQHELHGGIVFETAYVGTRGVHLQMVRFWNQVDRITGIRPYPGFTEFRYRDASESTVYHSWQSSVRKRFASGLNIGGNYTYASAYSYTDQGDLGLPGAVQDAFNVRADKAPPNDYLRHNFILDFIYELPLSKLSSSNSLLTRNLLHGWQVSGIFTARSGNPVNITQSTAFSASRGDYAGGVPLFDNYQQTLRYLNKSAFALVPIGAKSGAPIRPGNIGRNAIFDIGWWNLDFTASKHFYITEKFEGKLEAQMLNALNHTNLSGLQTNLTSSAFGLFTSTRGARVIQMNLRLSF
jgi:hypothetical protein